MFILSSSPGSLFYYVIGLLTVIYTIQWIRSYRRLSHIPGPSGWGASVFPWVKLHTGTNTMDRFAELSEKYGPLVRVAPNTLITSDAETLRRMSAPRSPYRRSLNYYAMRLNPGKDHVFSTMDEATHDDLRKKMAAGYSGKENLTLEEDINESILELCELIDRSYLTRGGDVRLMDLGKFLSYYALLPRG